MTSKKYIGKACAYCAPHGISTTEDHVVAREFFLAKDRPNLPKVPACERCNSLKSALEHYVLTVLPLGSRHRDAKAYSKENIERRLRKNPAIRRRLSLQHSGRWERQANGLFVPIMSVDVDQDQIRALFAFIVKGLFAFHWGEPLNEKWTPEVAIIIPHAEGLVFSQIIGKMGTNLEVVRGNFGRETFIYTGTRSRLTLKWFSLWQFTVFGGLKFGNAAAPNQAFTKLSAVTRPDMSCAPFSNEEIGLSNAAAA